MYNYKMYNKDSIDFLEKVINNSFDPKFWEPAIEMIKETPDIDITILIFTRGTIPIGAVLLLKEEDEDGDGEETTYIDRFEIADGYKNQGHGSRIMDTLRSIYNGTELQGYSIAPSAQFWAKNATEYDVDILDRYEEQHEGKSGLYEMDTKLMWFLL